MTQEDKCRRWASKHKEELWNRCNGLCERCGKPLIKESAVTHHTTYKKDLEYMRLVHKGCHVIIHQLQVEKNFLKKMIKWIKMYPENTPMKEIINLATDRLMDLNKDSDIPVKHDFPKNI
jgi:hypothetical protein